MSNTSAIKKPTSRIASIDVARGFALVAMTIYHFTWDLEFMGWLGSGTINQTGWIVFARAIASSFLLLAGVSLFLAHNEGIRWRAFVKRLIQVAGAAALISLATWFVVPQGFIFFGILHAIALFSLLALPFVGRHWWLAAMAVIAIFGVWSTVARDIFNSPALWWVGLSPHPPVSNDYVPVFPWLAWPLIGIALATAMPKTGWQWIAAIELPRRIQQPLSFIGRHSLIYYLVHQPVMLGLLWVFTTLSGGPDRTAAFIQACERSCTHTRDASFCTAFCGCLTDGLKHATLFRLYNEGKIDLTTNKTFETIRQQCSVDPTSQPKF